MGDAFGSGIVGHLSRHELSDKNDNQRNGLAAIDSTSAEEQQTAALLHGDDSPI